MQQKTATKTKTKQKQNLSGSVTESIINKQKFFWIPVLGFIVELFITASLDKTEESSMAIHLILGYAAVLFLANFERKTRYGVFPTGKLNGLAWFVFGFGLLYFTSVILGIIVGALLSFLAKKFKLNTNSLMIALMVVWALNIWEVMTSSYGLVDKFIFLFAPQVWMANAFINPFMTLIVMGVSIYVLKAAQKEQNEIAAERKPKEEVEDIEEEEDIIEETEEDIIEETVEKEEENKEKPKAKSFFQDIKAFSWSQWLKKKMKI